MDKSKAGYTEGIVSIIINSLLFVLKLWAGIVTGSIALTADAWHTLSDSISSVIVVIAVKLSVKKPDREHPFGHGRWEQIAALFIAFLLAIIAYDFLKEAVIQYRNREATQFGFIAIVVTILSIILKEALAQYAFYIARKTDNVSIKADGWHHRTDALSSVVVLIGILFAKQFWWIDSVLGVIIALMLFYATYEIAREAINKLLGENISDELIEKIIETAKTVYSEDFRMHHFHMHNYVKHQELTFHIKLSNQMSIEKGHQIATDIENIIFKKLGIRTTIHIEPLEFEHPHD
ncbi:MAG: cation diffusion facilitator family transporter [Bacteroidetes bacterium]|jgi:cation diffusion facilitator family transporter|nr:cation diffusion facilitator family transporter [Bacteroidota bacterium]